MDLIFVTKIYFIKRIRRKFLGITQQIIHLLNMHICKLDAFKRTSMMLLWKWWKFTKFHKIKLRILNWLYLSIVCIALRYCTARMVILLGFQSSMLTISAFNKSVRLYKVRSAAGKVDSALYSATKNLINILFKDIGNFSVFWMH